MIQTQLSSKICMLRPCLHEEWEIGFIRWPDGPISKRKLVQKTSAANLGNYW